MEGGPDSKHAVPGEGSPDPGVEADDERALLPPGTLLGKYRVIELLGRGGMGVVYKTEHVDLGMLRALKTLAPDLAHHPQARSRFLKEAKAAARINHPHVVRIFDTGEHDGIPFFVMEHLDGEDLDAALRRNTLTVEQTAGIMLAICAAIAEMHVEGIVHRDLKPGNIFLARNKVGEIVPTVLDFGIARAVERGPSATRTREGVVVGTPHYISPEQLADLPAGEQTDQYALGVVLYRCATGRLPFTGESTLGVYRAVARFQFVKPRELRPELPPEFEAVILRMMSERPSDRFPSMYEVGKALLPLASPKQRTVWADHYGRVRSPLGVVTMQIPIAGSAGWLLPRNATSLADHFRRVDTAVLRPEDLASAGIHGGRADEIKPVPLGETKLLDPSGPSGSSSDAGPSPWRLPGGSPSSPRQATPDRRFARPVLYVVAGAAVAVLIVGALLLWSGGRRAPPIDHPSVERETAVKVLGLPAAPTSQHLNAPHAPSQPPDPQVPPASAEIERRTEPAGAAPEPTSAPPHAIHHGGVRRPSAGHAKNNSRATSLPAERAEPQFNRVGD